MDDTYGQIADFAAGEVGCGYIYGATGWLCTPQRRQQQAAQYPEQAAIILGLGAKWDGKRCYDCAQLTRYAAGSAGAALPSGANTQWRSAPWTAQGDIATLPDQPGALLYRLQNGAAQHTGVYLGAGEAVDARGTSQGVIRQPLAAYPWTHWALPTLTHQPAPRRMLVHAPSGASVNLRDAPDTGRILARVPLGAQVALLPDDDGGEWARVRHGDVQGVMLRRFLRDVDADADADIPPDSPPDTLPLPRALCEALQEALRALLEVG